MDCASPPSMTLLRHAMLDALLADPGDAVVGLDANGIVTLWSAGASRLLGWSAADAVGRPARLVLAVDPEAGEPASDGGRWQMRADASMIWVDRREQPLRDATGGVVGSLVVLRDRTGERAAAEQQRAAAELAHGLLAASGDCVEVIGLDDALEYMGETGARDVALDARGEGAGPPGPSFWDDDGQAARRAVEVARQGGIGHFQGSANTAAGSSRWWEVQVSPINGPDGQPVKLLAVSRDITATRRGEAALREAQGLNTLILNSSRDCIVVLDLDGNTVFVSPGGIESMEVADVEAIIGLSWLRVWDGDDHVAARAAVAQARAGGTGRFRGFCPTHTGRPKWWDVLISPLPGPDGRPERLVSIGRDITDLVEAEERQRLLMMELDHRVKNTLTVVQAIAWQNFRGDRPLVEMRDAFAGRLATLANAHDVLIRGSWTDASLRALVDHVAELHGHGDAERFRVEGEEVRLGAKAALSFALVLHELGTNAVKYGALSAPGGHVGVTWRTSGPDGEPCLQFRWQEEGGPPVAPPGRQGFGSRLIERSFAADLNAKVRLDYRREGVILTLDAPLAALHAN